MPATHCGVHVDAIPVHRPGTEGMQIRNLMVLGQNESDLGRSDTELVVTGMERTKIQVEKKIDYFAAMIHRMSKYLEECQKVLVRARALPGMNDQEFEAHLTSANNQFGDGEAMAAYDDDAVMVAMGGLHEDIMSQRGAAKESLASFTRGQIERCRHAMAVLQVVAEVIPEKHDGDERHCQRVRYYAAIVAKPHYNDLPDWSDALRMVRETNDARVKDELESSAKRRKLGHKNEKEKAKNKIAEMTETESARRLWSEEYHKGWRDFYEVMVGCINQDGAGILKQWAGRECQQVLYSRPDRVDHTIGPGDKRLKDTPLALAEVNNVYAFVTEINSVPTLSRASLPQKHPEQSDDRYYLCDLFCAAEEALPVPSVCKTIMVQNHGDLKPMHPEESETGISFRRLPEDVRRQCIFELDLDNFRNPRSFLKKLSFGQWWEKQGDNTQVARLAASSKLMPSVAGVTSIFVQDTPLDAPVAASCIQRSTAVDLAAPSMIVAALDTPLDAVGEMTSARMQAHARTVDQLRALAARWVEGGDNTDLVEAMVTLSYTPACEIHRCAVYELLHAIPTSRHTCDSTRAMCNAAKSHEVGFFGSPETIKRYTHERLKAPDMEAACNAMQERLLKYECPLGIASVHPAMALMHCSLLDAMTAHRKLYINVCYYGFGQTGKDTLVDRLVKWCSVKGTIKIFGHTSALAQLGHGPGDAHLLCVYNEALDSIAAPKGQKSETGNVAVSRAKNGMTENEQRSSTLTHVDGVKMTVELARAFLCATAYISNLDSVSQIPEALLTRLIPMQIAMAHRENHGAADKNAFSTMGNNNKDSLKEHTKGYFVQQQCHIFLHGTCHAYGGLEAVDMTIFSVVTKQINTALRQLGMQLDPRTIEQAMLLAKVFTCEGNYFRTHQTPHGRHCGSRFGVTEATLFDHRHRWEMEAICSEAIARSSMRLVLGRFRQGTLCKVAKAIMWIIKQGDQKYSKMFVAQDTIRETNHQQKTCVVDLHHVRFTVPKEGNSSMTFATKVSHALMDSTSQSITPSQVNDIFHDMCKLGELEHNELDMRLVIDPTYEDPLGGGPLGADEVYTVNGWREVCKSAQTQVVIDPAWLDKTKDAWRKNKFSRNEEEFASGYWPQEVDGGDTVTNRVMIMDDLRSTGTIYISTAFLGRASRDGFVNEFDQKLTAALMTTMTTERVIARPPADMMEANPEVPYLCFTERARPGPQQPSITNQEFVTTGHHANLFGGEKKAKFRDGESITFEANVPIDTQVTKRHVERLSNKYPTALPTAHQLLAADPSGVCCRFGPHILDELARTSPVFRISLTQNDSAAAFASRKALVAAHLTQQYGDLMRHCHGPGADPRTWQNLETTPDADGRATEFTLKIAHQVTELSYAKRMGDLRPRALNVEACSVKENEIRHTERVLAMMTADPTCPNIDGAESDEDDEPFNEVLRHLRYAEPIDARKRIAELQKEVNKTRTLHKMAVEDAGINLEFDTFLEEWRSLSKKGAHTGPGYVNYLRRNGRRMMAAREKRDGVWMRVLDDLP